MQQQQQQLSGSPVCCYLWPAVHFSPALRWLLPASEKLCQNEMLVAAGKMPPPPPPIYPCYLNACRITCRPYRAQRLESAQKCCPCFPIDSNLFTVFFFTLLHLLSLLFSKMFKQCSNFWHLHENCQRKDVVYSKTTEHNMNIESVRQQQQQQHIESN